MRNLIILFFGFLSAVVLAQNGSIWYFGGGDAGGTPTYDAAGLDFSSNLPTPLPAGQGQLVSFEGCASLSDNIGNIILYTGGSSVYDRTHTVMPNGSSATPVQ